MSWNSKLFAYCERGPDPAFWAEPLNALSNVAFLIAAMVALGQWRRQTPGSRDTDVLTLILLVFLIGIGSFLFHTLATRWAGLADTLPIWLFMVGYLAFALHRFVGLGGTSAGLLTLGFMGLMAAAGTVTCSGGPCLNGSVGYLPALAAMALVGGLLHARHHAAAKSIAAAAAVFTVSLALRTIDRAVCPYTILATARGLGTHFLWHLLNATVLYLLLGGALRHGRAAPEAREIAPAAGLRA